MENVLFPSPRRHSAGAKKHLCGRIFKVLRRQAFGSDFLFGAGSASYQHEGAAAEYNRGPSIWDDFCLSKPGKIKYGTNGNVAIDMYGNHKEDIQIMKKMRLTTFRMSISWSRIFPGGRLCRGVNKDGVKYYHDFIDELVANGIQPFVTLFHFDFPQALQDEYGGFLSEKVVDDFLEYANFCFWEFGDRVKYWATFNEPYVFTIMGYGLGYHAPGRGLMSAYATGDMPLAESTEETSDTHDVPQKKIWDSHEVLKKKIKDSHALLLNKHITHIVEAKLLNRTKSSSTNQTQTQTQGSGKQPYPHIGDDGYKEPYIVAKNILLCHKAAVELYWSDYKESQNGKIGITLNCDWMIPAQSVDREATERALDFMLGWFLEPLTRGHYPKRMTDRVGPDRLPPPFRNHSPHQPRKYYDFVGINYYYTSYVENKAAGPHDPVNCFNDVEVKYLNREQKAFGMFELLRHVKNKYDDPLIYVTENGFYHPNDPKKTHRDVCDDMDRASFILQNLAWILAAKYGAGVNVNGYFVWSLFDGFEWNAGYDCRFGLNYVDFTNNNARYPNKSAVVYKNFLAGIPLELPYGWYDSVPFELPHACFDEDCEENQESGKPKFKKLKT